MRDHHRSRLKVLNRASLSYVLLLGLVHTAVAGERTSGERSASASATVPLDELLRLHDSERDRARESERENTCRERTFLTEVAKTTATR